MSRTEAAWCTLSSVYDLNLTVVPSAPWVEEDRRFSFRISVVEPNCERRKTQQPGRQVDGCNVAQGIWHRAMGRFVLSIQCRSSVVMCHEEGE